MNYGATSESSFASDYKDYMRNRISEKVACGKLVFLFAPILINSWILCYTYIELSPLIASCIAIPILICTVVISIVAWRYLSRKEEEWKAEV